MQAAGNLVGILVELATGMQDAHDDFGGRALRLMLVVKFDADRNTATVIRHRNRIVGMDGDDYFITMTRQRLVDGIVDHLEYHVMQTSAIGSITDIHARPLPDCLQPFELLDGVFVVTIVDLATGLGTVNHALILLPCLRYAWASQHI